MEPSDKKAIKQHLEAVVGERAHGFSDTHLKEVMKYLEAYFTSLGYELELHSFKVTGTAYNNIIARKWGRDRNERIVVGAHFDSVAGSPGADDNASGVAVMLEAARILADRDWNYTIEFIGFHLEEWNMLGSAAYVKDLKQAQVKIRGMVSLEMVGFTSQAPESQQMPPGFALFYPDVGNFIAVVGNARSIGLLNTFKRNLKSITALPVESLIMPLNGALLPATRLSDHSPFWDAGYPALLITDTSFFRNPFYHGPEDTIETLDLDFMLKVTDGVARAVAALDQ